MHKVKIIIGTARSYQKEASRLIMFLNKHSVFHITPFYFDEFAVSGENLIDLINESDQFTIFILLVGHDTLICEAAVEQLDIARMSRSPQISSRSIVLFLQDCWTGGNNLRIIQGRQYLNSVWEDRITLFESEMIVSAKALDKDEQETASPFDRRVIIRDQLMSVKAKLVFVVDFLLSQSYQDSFDAYVANSKLKFFDSIFLELPNTQDEAQIHGVELEYLFKTIKINSSKDVRAPEFPPAPFYQPRFPASEIHSFRVPGFNNVWIKDESTNPTGSHKDRMALEIVVQYKAFLESLKFKKRHNIPQLSIISSGSAALSIQHMLNLYRIPTRLRVLHDISLKLEILNNLEQCGCLLFPCDLSLRQLTSEEIKQRTENFNGIDLTYREIIDPNNDNYYDWMSYETINHNADYCFVPFGTGDLFINILKIAKREFINSLVSRNDSRYSGSIETLRRTIYFGATTDLKDSKLTKLYSAYLPSFQSHLKYLEECKKVMSCGSETSVLRVDEKYVYKAAEIAADNNLIFEYSGIAGLALLLQIKESISPDARILIVNTGKTKCFSEIRQGAAVHYDRWDTISAKA